MAINSAKGNDIIMLCIKMPTVTLVMVACLLLVSLTPTKAGEVNEKPNILLILSDDQDLTLEGMTPMRQVQKLIAKAGGQFSHAVGIRGLFILLYISTYFGFLSVH